MTDSLVAKATALLHGAFPWRAMIEYPDGSGFVSLVYHALEADDDGATVYFERDPSDTSFHVSWDDLHAACATGVLRSDGQRWVRQPEVSDLHLLSFPTRDILGGQSDSDNAWRARMRLHQSWWRAFRLRVPPGIGPNKGDKVLRGNMLDDQAAADGRNFLSPAAKQAYDDRLAQTKAGIDPWRTTRNLLASQPMAFNLFGHLAHHLDLATGVFAELLGDDEIGEVTGIEIERLSNALGDRTAFDVFATYRRPDGAPGCLAVETKLTEPFSQKAYDWSHYIAHPVFSADIWSTTDPVDLGDRRWSQLFRNHLLAEAETATHPDLGAPTVLVVHHPTDPDCSTHVAGYRQHLADPARVQAVDLGRIAAALRETVEGDGDRAWLADFEDRYLKLDLSTGLEPFTDF